MRRRRGTAADGAILAPMPGRIIAVEVAAGDTVAKGQKLVTLEAMKMEHSLTAPFDGTVAELNASRRRAGHRGRDAGAGGAERMTANRHPRHWRQRDRDAGLQSSTV